MRLSNVEIREIVIHRGSKTSSKSLVLHLHDGSRFNILLGVGKQIMTIDGPHLLSQNLDFMAPTRYMFEAHIAISYNLLLRKFLIVKHRFAADNTRFNSINEVNRLLSQQFSSPSAFPLATLCQATEQKSPRSHAKRIQRR